MMIRTTVERAMAILKNPAYQGDANFQQRLQKLETVVLPQIDSWEFGRRCLGQHWQTLNESQRQEFIELFKSLLEKIYGGMLDRYPDGVEFSYDEERIEGDFAEVQTRIRNPTQDTQFSVIYRLHQKDDKWLIYDVVTENVSMVRNYQTQFNRILDKSSYEGLRDTLKSKIAQLETAPPS